MQFSIQCLTRWDLDFCLWKLLEVVFQRELKGSSCPHRALGKVWLPKACSLPLHYGMFSACLLALFLQHSGHTIKPSYTDLCCPEQLMCWMKVVPVCWTEHDVTRKYRGLVLTSQCFFTKEVGLLVNFYKTKKERARKNRECSYAFSKAPII